MQAWQPTDVSEVDAMKLLATGEYMCQEKADGMHLFGGKLNDQVVAFNRNGQTTDIQADLMRILEKIPDNTLTDGERIWGGAYILFDAIRINGEDLMEERADFRFQAISYLVQALDCPLIQLIRCATDYDSAVALINQLKKETAEGFIIKRKDSKYLPGKRVDKTILRTKWRKEADVILFHSPKATKRSLMMYVMSPTSTDIPFVGTLVGGNLQYVGDVNAYAYFERVPPGEIRVGRVTYLYATKDTKLNQPVIEALRDDKAPGECLVSQLVKGKRFLTP